MKSDAKNLLEDILARTEGAFLSDLHAVEQRPAVCAALEQIAAHRYPLRDWNEAVHYLVQRNADFTDAQAARTFLLETLAK